jgi:hypothetical protein
MTNIASYIGNQGGNTANTDRRPSPFIWNTCPWREIQDGTIDGIADHDDFNLPYLTTPTTEAVYGKYKAFSSTGGTITPAAGAQFGTLTLGSDGDDEGANVTDVRPFVKISANLGKLWFETRAKVNSIAVTQFDAFVGLSQLFTGSAILPITATAGAMADLNLVGFLRPGTGTTGDGSSLKCIYKADGVTLVTVETLAAQFVADTYIKLGFVFDPKDNYLRFYVNGIEVDSKLIPDNTGTDFPADTVMGRCAAVLNTAAVTSLFTIDWWRVAQLGV